MEPDIRRCKEHQFHFDVKNGCPFCPSAQEVELKRLRSEVAAWKDAWFHARDLIGKSYWEIPPWGYVCSHPDGVRIDPRALRYHAIISELLQKLFLLLDMIRTHEA